MADSRRLVITINVGALGPRFRAGRAMPFDCEGSRSRQKAANHVWGTATGTNPERHRVS